MTTPGSEGRSGIDNENAHSKGSDPEEVNLWNWKDYIPALLAFSSALFIILRLLSISGLSFTTTEGIVQASGTATVIIGALIPAVATFIIPLSLILCAMLAMGRIEKSSRMLVVAFTVFLIFAAIKVSPVISDIFVLACAPAVILDMKAPATLDSLVFPRWIRKKGGRGFSAYYVAGLTVLLLFTITSNSDPWYPPEIIKCAHAYSYNGYVVGETGSDVTILTYRTRQIVHIASSSIISRTVCRESGTPVNGIFADTLAMLITGSKLPYYPECRI